LEAGEEGQRRPWAPPQPFCFHLTAPSLALPASGCVSFVCRPLILPLLSPLRGSPHPQQSLKAESRPLEGSPAQLPILADMLLYYCRFAARPVLLQVYQTEVRPVLPLQTG